MACIQGCQTSSEMEKAMVENIEGCTGCSHQKMDGGVIICTLLGGSGNANP